MTSTGKKESNGMMKSIFAAHLILVLHVLLLAGLGCLILFFGVIVQYLFWILFVGSAGIFLAGYLLKRKMVREGKQLRDMLALPSLKGRTIEVSILGGMASLRLENPGNIPINQHPRLTEHSGHSGHLIDSNAYQLRELSELVDLYNKNLITLDEYNKFKTKLIDS